MEYMYIAAPSQEVMYDWMADAAIHVYEQSTSKFSRECAFIVQALAL